MLFTDGHLPGLPAGTCYPMISSFANPIDTRNERGYFLFKFFGFFSAGPAPRFSGSTFSYCE
jgi:hypothetical protein